MWAEHPISSALARSKRALSGDRMPTGKVTACGGIVGDPGLEQTSAQLRIASSSRLTKLLLDMAVQKDGKQ